MTEPKPTHHDIIVQVRNLENDLEKHRTLAETHWNETREAFHSIARTLSVIGGQVERIEETTGALSAKVMAYYRLRDKIIGAGTMAGLALAVLWWMTKDAIGKLFGVTP